MKRLKEIQIVSIQLVSLARREQLRTSVLLMSNGCFHSISFSCEKRENEHRHLFGRRRVSIQLVSLARREHSQNLNLSHSHNLVSIQLVSLARREYF